MKKAKKEAVFYIYKITLLCGSLKDSYYIGKRKFPIPVYYTKEDLVKKLQDDPMIDPYKGSGKIITNYFKKNHPEFNKTFIKEIIKFSESFEDNYKAEEIILGDLWKTDEKCLNLIKGGVCAQNPDSVAEQVQLYNKTHPIKRGFKHTEQTKQLNREAAIKRWQDPQYREHVLNALSEYRKKHFSPNLGTHLSEERKQHLREINLGKPNPKNAGINNGMYGKIPANAKSVLQIDLQTNQIIAEFPSADAAARNFGAKRGCNIKKVITGERISCFGYGWKYK